MMPEIKYHKDMNHNYLIIKCQGEPAGDKYQLKMITDNKIPGLLGCSTRFINGDVYLYYEVNSLQSLTTLYEYKQMDKPQAVRLLTGFRRALREIQAFLLVDSGLLLHPEYIYVDWEQEEVYFVYYPYETGREENTVKQFMEFLINVIDHRDERLVEMVYGLCQLAERNRLIADELDYYLENALLDSREEPAQSPAAENRQSIYHTDAVTPMTAGLPRQTQPGPTRQPPLRAARQALSGLTRQTPPESVQPTPSGFAQQTSPRSARLTSGEVPSESDLLPGETASVPPLEKKQKIKHLIMAVTSLTGSVAILYIRSHYLLNPRESLLTWILLFTFLFIFLISGIIFLLFHFSICTEKRPLPGTDWSAAAAGPEAEPALPSPEDQPVEKYGDTVFLYSAEEIRENKLYGLNKGNKYHIDLGKLPCTIGKMAGCADYCITEASVSRLHVKFTGKENAVYMTDLNSTNGTYKNGLRLQPSETVQIEPGDEIRLGKLIFSYR